MKALILGTLTLAASTGRGFSAPAAPYPPSEVIKAIEWHWETYTNAALGSDLWPVTWGPDDNLYGAWGDGGGFGGSDKDGRVSLGFARIEGSPEHWHGVNINGGKNPEHPASFPKKGKTGTLIFVQGVLYAWVNLQDGTWPNVNHQLAWSTNYGATWTMADWRFPKDEGAFQPSAFITFGKDYAGVPPSLAGYIYFYGVKLSTNLQSAGRNYLARVPAAKIRKRSAYEFFDGVESGGKAKWTTNWAQARPVFTDLNSERICSAVYVPALKRYLAASFHRGPGQLGVFDSPNPWGPWTTVCYDEYFGRMRTTGEGLICEFPQKWMSADGLTLWSIFSCYGDGAKMGIYGHDRFNLIKATLQLYPNRNSATKAGAE